MRFVPRHTLRGPLADRDLSRSSIALAVCGWTVILALALGALEPTHAAWILAALLVAAVVRGEMASSRDRNDAVPDGNSSAPAPVALDECREEQLMALASELPSCKDLPIMLEEAAARLARIFDARWVEIVTPAGDEATFDSDDRIGAGASISVSIPAAEGYGHLALETNLACAPSPTLRDDLQRAAVLVAEALERLEIRTMLREAQASVEETKTAKREFLANTSHEIRTPLNGIVGSAHLLSSTELDETQSEFVETIVRCSDQLLAVMNDVLELATLESGSTAIVDRPFDARGCVEAVARLARKNAREGVEVVAECSAGIEHDLIGPGPQIQRALTHLASNAVEFTETGRIIVSAHTLSHGSRAGGRVRIRFAVEDTGVGIPAERREAIFERFSQADGGSTREHQGAGLGLSIADELVTLMGSTIELESEVGTGSTFAFVLELEVSEGAAELEWDETRASGADGERGQGRVLVVDDNPINLRVAQRTLERRGYSVELASDGLEAVEAALEGGFDLILMDVQMPVMDGIEATVVLLERWRKEDRPETPIVALTAHAMDEDRRRCLDAGMAGFLTKPLRGEELDDALARLVDPDRAVA